MRKTSISNLLKDFQIKSLTGIFLDLNSWNSENYFIVLHQGAIISQIIKEFQFLLISDGESLNEESCVSSLPTTNFKKFV